MHHDLLSSVGGRGAQVDTRCHTEVGTRGGGGVAHQLCLRGTTFHNGRRVVCVCASVHAMGRPCGCGQDRWHARDSVPWRETGKRWVRGAYSELPTWWLRRDVRKCRVSVLFCSAGSRPALQTSWNFRKVARHKSGRQLCSCGLLVLELALQVTSCMPGSCRHVASGQTTTFEGLSTSHLLLTRKC